MGKKYKIVTKIIGTLTQPFGFSPDVPDFGLDEGINQEAAIQGVLLNKDSAIANIPIIIFTDFSNFTSCVIVLLFIIISIKGLGL